MSWIRRLTNAQKRVAGLTGRTMESVGKLFLEQLVVFENQELTRIEAFLVVAEE